MITIGSDATISNHDVFALAIKGARMALDLADKAVEEAIAKYGEDRAVEYPETCYELPAVFAWDGRDTSSLVHLPPIIASYRDRISEALDINNALVAGEATMIAAEMIEAIKYIDGPDPYEGTPYSGFIPDRVLRELGFAFVDDTIPGAVVLVGKCPDVDALTRTVRDLQSKGLIIIASGEIVEQLVNAGTQMGERFRLYPVGVSTQIVHALNFAIRAALSFGGVQRGDREGIASYLAKRPKVIVLEYGPLDPVLAGAAMAAVLNGATIVTDQPVEGVPDKMVHVRELDKMVPIAIEARGIKVCLAPVDIPVAYGPAFEGEVVRRPDTYIEAGGAAKTLAFELLRMRAEDEIQDGRTTVIGPDVDALPEGGRTTLAILVDVYGKKMLEDFEGVLERRIHLFVNYAEGAWHTGQRNVLWVRLSKRSVAAGLRFKHFGDILITKLKEEFGNIVSRVQVTIVTNEEEVQRRLPEALDIYAARDARMADLTDEKVDTYYSCLLCVPSTEDIMMADGSFTPMGRFIEDLADNGPSSVMTFDKDHTTSGSSDAIYVNPSPKELLKITLRNGNSLTLTSNHNVLVDKKDGLRWIRAGNLEKNDTLLEVVPCCCDTSKGSLFIIDYLPEDYLISDDDVYDRLKVLIEKNSSIKDMAKLTGISYYRLYSALYSYPVSRKRLKIWELRKVVTEAGHDWDTIKGDIRRFQSGVTISRAKIDNDIMYSAGLIASDGCVRWRGPGGRSGTCVQFTNTEQRLTDEFAHIMEDFFGSPPCEYVVEPSISRSEKLTIHPSKLITVSLVNNTLYGRLLNGLRIGTQDRKQKWDGYVISKLSNDLIASFLRGMFDGDGYALGNRAHFTTRSYNEARHIHLLLKRLGISSFISKGMRGYQVGTVSDGDAIRFRERIGSCHPSKSAILERMIPRKDKNHVSRYNSIPLFCGPQLNLLLDQYGINKYRLPVANSTIRSWRDSKRRPSKEKMRLVLDAIGPSVPSDNPTYRMLLSWTNSDVNFQKVCSIDHVPCDSDRVFNFSVPVTHNYVINGIVVKNCASFAADHVCVVTPERLGLCGAVNWLDAQAAVEIDPHGPNQPIVKGECLDPVKGQWQGVNDAVYEASHHKVERFNAYTMMEDPMTSCGCFEVIVAMTADMQGVIVVNREYPGMTPIGMKFSSLAGSVGGGRQTPGFIGVGRKYITSRKFIPADGGFLRIAWMPRELKEALRDRLQKRAEELGEPGFVDKIADETVTTEADGLTEWMMKVDHPALKMPPLIS